jgi:hypothetical protein
MPAKRKFRTRSGKSEGSRKAAARPRSAGSRRPRLRHLRQHDGGEGERRGAVEQEEEREGGAGEEPRDRQRRREPQVHRPVDEPVSADARRRLRDEVGHRGLHGGPEDVGSEAEKDRRRREHLEPLDEAERHHREAGRRQRRDERGAPAHPVG